MSPLLLKCKTCAIFYCHSFNYIVKIMQNLHFNKMGTYMETTHKFYIYEML